MEEAVVPAEIFQLGSGLFLVDSGCFYPTMEIF